MKPDWDQLASEYAASTTVQIADVDCTAEGEPLCSRFDVQGFPTIKSFSPFNSEGEDYEGERGLDALRAFVETMGKDCTAASKENCDAEQLAELEEALKAAPEELAAELATLKEKLETASSEHDALVESLEKQYEASESALEELKTEVKPRIKLLRAATATPAGKEEL